MNPLTKQVTTSSQAPQLFRIFGRQILSDFPLDRLGSEDVVSQIAVTMQNSGRPFAALDLVDRELPQFTREPSVDGLRYVAPGVGEFLIHGRGERVTYSLAAGVRAADVQHILTGPALIMALQLQGEFLLHGGAIERNGRVFAVSAPHGFGKSTLTAAFYRAGHRVRSDDVVPIRDHGGVFLGGQGQPWIKLWDNALERFGEDAAKYDPVLTGFKKRIVPGVTSEGELSLGAVYLLLPHLDESKPTEFRQLTGLEGALGLMGAVYSPETIVGELAVRNLDFATRLAARVPVRLASYYRTFENLPTIRDAILRDFDEVSGA